ncbi:hypothetical protein SPRG_13235 [Saprolegnia parasitica CBS 223.65]|uniref:Disintegrin domain-containing protein n=1 Tax=Saprolegnia parasitica (strain CBS 223.65) TaxID=695850 RepID=A0A067BQJ6_SAPPC|nr:hypothetical protein SPRG_13235 [Saprolegnia parasitica CBS 223.65]KDO20538.1 hypothetical protein SPRG_13235 [Saprolegnia parasitica CBS 223.65]|eukprot:XP_012208731.1 hypothetical protein SPRG_13235 [Saprolegnia parasitica CBS 223.65]
MKLLWVCVAANAIGLSLGMDLLASETAPVGANLLAAAATKCTRDNDCPQLTCHSTSCSTFGYCKYTPLGVGAKCPGQSCTNGALATTTPTTRATPTPNASVPEYCTGTSGTCPVDAFAPSTMTCSGANNRGACDGQDLCDGFGHCVDVYLPSSTVCRASKGECDVAESCSGKSSQCPPTRSRRPPRRARARPTTSFAMAPISSSTKCSGTSNSGVCDGQDMCDGSGKCVDKYLPSSNECRASKGPCDVAETCTGQGSECPVDTFAPTTAKCTGSSNSGACDIQDFCDGQGNCVDKYLPSTSVCRSSKNQCDVAEMCTGSSGACPADAFAPTTATCTGTCNGNACDGVDLCDGKGNCIDVYLPSTTVCRKAASDCDVAESCTGSSGQCPSDKFAPTTAKCTGTCNGNPCDAQDFCDGSGNCVDKYLPSDTVCGTTGNACIIPATCTGDMGFCPPDDYADSSVPCSGTSSGNVCDGIDTCDGEGSCVDRFLGARTVCQKPTGYSRPIYCNGKSATCPVAKSFLEGNLREMTADDQAPVQSMLVAVSPSSPMVLLGLVCVVAAAVAMVTMRQRRDEPAFDDATYKLLATHEDASAAF